MSQINMINVMHVLLIAPLLIYFGTIKDCNEYHNRKRVLLVIGILVLIYHLYKIILAWKKN